MKRGGILSMIRERDESLVLEDTLNHLSSIADGVLILDDASSDNSVSIALSHPLVVGVILNTRWSSERAEEETIHRSLLHKTGKSLKPKWFFYSDADERFEGEIRGFLQSHDSDGIDGIRISLFDSYITKSDKRPYTGGALKDFRKYYGQERRDILMIWKNIPSAEFIGIDAREPSGVSKDKTIVKFYCQHYGKSISIDQWEQTCDYYINSFPLYSDKWKKRKGQAVHTMSDFNTPLYVWSDVKRNSIIIHPVE